MPDNTKSKEAVGFARLTGLAYLVVFFVALSWAKDFLLPIVLAVLITFLLRPPVSRLGAVGAPSGFSCTKHGRDGVRLDWSGLRDSVGSSRGFNRFPS